MRAFVAIELSREVRDVLAGLVGHLELARVRSLRTVNPDGIHLTLKFLGEVSEQLAPSIAGEVERAVAGHSPFTLNIDGSGVFPDERRVRVLWVGLQGDLPSLLGLRPMWKAPWPQWAFAERSAASVHT